MVTNERAKLELSGGSPPRSARKQLEEWHIWTFDVGYWRYTPDDRVWRSVETAKRAAQRYARNMSRSDVLISDAPIDRPLTTEQIERGSRLLWGFRRDGSDYGTVSRRPELEGPDGWLNLCIGAGYDPDSYTATHPPAWW